MQWGAAGGITRINVSSFADQVDAALMSLLDVLANNFSSDDLPHAELNNSSNAIRGEGINLLRMSSSALQFKVTL